MTRRRRRCERCRFPMRLRREGVVPGTKLSGARGLCNGCYSWIQTTGRLDRYPRRMQRAADVLDDAMVYAYRGGMTRADIARQLGYRSFDSLYQVFRRAGRGDLYSKFKDLTESVAA